MTLELSLILHEFQNNLITPVEESVLSIGGGGGVLLI